MTDLLKSDKPVQWGMLFYAFSAPLSNALAELSIGILAFLWIVRMLLSRRFIFYKNRVMYVLLLYIVYNGISALLSISPRSSFLAFGQEWIVVLFIVIVSNVEDLSAVRRAFVILIAVSAGVAVYGIWQHFFGIDIWRGRIIKQYGGFFRAEGFFGLCLTYGGFMLMVFTAAAGGFWGASSSRQKKWFFSTMLLLLLTIIACNTRSVWIGAAAGVLLLGFRLNLRTFVYTVSGLTVVVAALFVFHPGLIYSKSTQSIFDTSSTMPRTNRIRMELWNKSAEIIKDNPVFGIGPGNMNLYYDEYDFSDESRGLRHSHNDILNVGVSAGLPGIFLFLCIWFMVIKSGFSLHLREKFKNDILGYLNLGAAFGILGILTAGLFQCFYTDVETGMLWWFLSGLVVISDKLTAN